jgi:hypothetical protein
LITIHLAWKLNDDDKEAHVPSEIPSLSSDVPSTMVPSRLPPATMVARGGDPSTLHPFLPVDGLPSDDLVPSTQIADSISPILHDYPPTVSPSPVTQLESSSSFPSITVATPTSTIDGSTSPTTDNPNRPVASSTNMPSKLAINGIDEGSYVPFIPTSDYESDSSTPLASPTHQPNVSITSESPTSTAASRPVPDVGGDTSSNTHDLSGNPNSGPSTL